MNLHIKQPTIIESAGNKPKLIREFVGRINSGSEEISFARMTSPGGWEEPAQTPEFDEYTFVLKGLVQVKTQSKVYRIAENQMFKARKGITVQYSTPLPEGAEYIAVCLPAYSSETVHREEV
jgi:mannose-6-phosphate isomerase-like protein (cupin superfamily)